MELAIPKHSFAISELDTRFRPRRCVQRPEMIQITMQRQRTWQIGLFCSVAVLLCVGWSGNLGFRPLTIAWHIEPMQPSFGDTRVITSGLDSKKLGLDPLVENLSDPWRRRMNYPRIWQQLAQLGLGQQHTTVLGITLGLSFAVGCLLYMWSCTRRVDQCFLVAAVLSPVSVLCVERGNIDLMMFFLVSVFSLVVGGARSTAKMCGAAFILISAFVLKLFPIFASVAFVRYPRRHVASIGGLLVSFAVIYVSFNRDELRLIRSATPSASTMAYGVDVLWMQLAKSGHLKQSMGKLISWSLFGVCLTLALIGGFVKTARLTAPPVSLGEGDLTSFRVAAAIYVGTFALGNNYDYRLVFCIPSIVFLLAMCRGISAAFGSKAQRGIATVTLGALLVSLWHILILKSLGRYFGSIGYHIAFIVDEISNWLLVAGYCWFLGATMFWLPRSFVPQDVK